MRGYDGAKWSEKNELCTVHRRVIKIGFLNLESLTIQCLEKNPANSCTNFLTQGYTSRSAIIMYKNKPLPLKTT